VRLSQHAGRPRGMTNSTPTKLGGYEITSYEEIAMGCGVAFTATITKDGKKVLTVENSGRGGCHTYGGVGSDWAGWREAEAEFEAFAKEWNKNSGLAGFEDTDALVWHLIEVAALNQKRVVMFLLDDEDWFESGVGRSMKAGVTYEQAYTYIAKTFPGRSARIWNKTLSEFVTVEG